MTTRKCVLTVIALAAAFYGQAASAQAPRVSSFQGMLTDNVGTPLDGSYDISIALYEAASGGSSIWSRTYSGVSVGNGVFNLVLEDGAPDFASVAFDDSLWVQVTVGAEMVPPRTRLTAAPFAMGLSLPLEATVKSGGGPALNIVNESPNLGTVALRGVVTDPSGQTTAIEGLNHSTSGIGVVGVSTPSTGTGRGVWGESSSASGIGVYGRSFTVTGAGVGVSGEAMSPEGWPGYFTGGRGVYARGADNDSPDLVLGGAGSGDTEDDGRIFSDPDYSGSDIWITSNDAVVVTLDANATGSNGDFWVEDSGSNILLLVSDAGVTTVNDSMTVNGNLHVDGNLSKSSGSFRIDHPLDPENKFLQHSFVESPDMMNVYNGNVELDANGDADIVLPSYFEALNRDFRYQLTPIGVAAPNLHVSRKIVDGRFAISGGSPGQEISWQVTGIRKDTWAVEHPIEVEVEKSPEDKGLGGQATASRDR